MSDLGKPLVEKLETIDEENQLNVSEINSIITLRDKLCKICFDENEDITLPCKHMICRKCLNKLNKKECPFCRAKFEIKHKDPECFSFVNILNKICSLILLLLVIFVIYLENK